MAAAFSVRRADYLNARDAAAVVALLDAYASDPAGGGEPLSDFIKANLARELAARPQAYSVLAFDGEQPVGLVNCIEGFSSFDMFTSFLYEPPRRPNKGTPFACASASQAAMSRATPASRFSVKPNPAVPPTASTRATSASAPEARRSE